MAQIQQNIDISEDFINNLGVHILKILLQDHTRSTAKSYASIFWATDNYKRLGPDYAYNMPITPELITGKHNKVVQPRVVKSKAVQAARSKDMAEVFTPSWVCNSQNNLVDENWFGRKNVFNEEIDNEDGAHSWRSSVSRILFPSENPGDDLSNTAKDWKAYVNDPRMEITCGDKSAIKSKIGDKSAIKSEIGDICVEKRSKDHLKEFEENGKIEPIGANKNRRYRLSAKTQGKL